ncbi:iron-binding CDGSH zinc finger protein [Knoellia remsis]|uniref:Iron-binding CDGSH zinc finger protein n=1 Tax=Knoellia remsis TaxID=407159 RepID=A0A2T0U4V2_9MICO|nr:CDGSH iron-sulfur domain-containing protein [Knoellia remsis]PRY52955.1 iron-binding CDGSH zinc finger protein [Knoellia remsis]
MNAERDDVTRVVVTSDGPILVDGPVEVVTAEGTTVHSDRTVVAICTCKRSRIQPFCDTSHRKKVRPERSDDGDTSDDIEPRGEST